MLAKSRSETAFQLRKKEENEIKAKVFFGLKKIEKVHAMKDEMS
jgi:hypothetical protein